MAGLHFADLIAVLVYMTLCVGVGVWSSYRGNPGSVKGYFLAGRSMKWLPVGASIFATNVGSQFFIGMAGAAAANGISVVIYEWHAVYILVLLGWVFVPVYVSSKAYTMPEFLQKRYGGQRLRIFLSSLYIFLLVIQQMSGAMYAGAVFIQQSVGWNMYVSIVTITVATGTYTVIGGLAAVIWTDAIQTLILLFGTGFLLVKGLLQVGGVNGLFVRYLEAAPNITQCANNVTAGFPRADSLHIFRDPVDGDIPWPGAIFGLTPMAIVAWCTDQISVQRILAAKSHSHAKGGVVMAGFLKMLPMILIVFPGMISRAMFPDEVGCVDPAVCQSVCDNEYGCTDIAYPKLVMEIMPAGLRGLMIAVMLSALMSSLTSYFNSGSTMFTLDLYVRVRKRASERELMIVGRIFIVVFVGVSVAWIPILTSAEGGQLWSYLQSIQAYTAPPWCMVFLLGIFWKRTTEQGAFWGVLAGLTAGLTRMIMEFIYTKPACGEPEKRPELLYKVNFLYFAILVAGLTSLVTVTVSLFTSPRPEAKLRRVTWSTRNSTLPREESDTEDDIDEDGTKTEDGLEQQNKVHEPLTIRRRVYKILCCYPTSVAMPTKMAVMEEEQQMVYRGKGEAPWIKRFLNVQAAFLLLVVTFLIGFFA